MIPYQNVCDEMQTQKLHCYTVHSNIQFHNVLLKFIFQFIKQRQMCQIQIFIWCLQIVLISA